MDIMHTINCSVVLFKANIIFNNKSKYAYIMYKLIFLAVVMKNILWNNDGVPCFRENIDSATAIEKLRTKKK